MYYLILNFVILYSTYNTSMVRKSSLWSKKFIVKALGKACTMVQLHAYKNMADMQLVMLFIMLYFQFANIHMLLAAKFERVEKDALRISLGQLSPEM